jgi:signal transduction histidine kinase
MKLLLHKKKLILPAFLLFAGFCVSQTRSLDTLRNSMHKLDIYEAKKYLKGIDTSSLKKYDKALWYFYKGLNYRKEDDHDRGFENLFRAEKLFEELDSVKDAADTNYEIVVLLSHQGKNTIDAKPFLDKFIAYAESQNDPLTSARAYSRIASNYMQVDSFQKSKEYYLKTFDRIKKIKEKNIREICQAKIELNYGSLYRTVPKQIEGKKEYDSALYFYEKALPFLIKYKQDNDIATAFNNIAYSYFGKEEYQKAIKYYKKADSIPLKQNNAKTKLIFYKNIAEAYEKAGNFEYATFFYKKWTNLKDSINAETQNIAIARYQNAELIADNTKQKAKNTQTNAYLTISLSVLALVIITAFFLQKNTRKKQLLAIQAKDLEAQKVENLLKEQELASIDAMIEGQEKERKRIAEDLHDDLGALMATISLYLENVGAGNNPNALDKTKTLLGEAYNKIRNISHIKNAGVIANQGLLIAVKNMASKISSANKIDIEVVAHGLGNRLENSLELSLFRTIQELITNIIKHAEATKATIQLTQHENSLNIIVEDNGKGFNTNEIKESGIGLNNIKKRIQHLDGKLTIDSSLTKGTTILIDIPIEA